MQIHCVLVLVAKYDLGISLFKVCFLKYQGMLWVLGIVALRLGNYFWKEDLCKVL